jgi:hypothetical protein
MTSVKSVNNASNAPLAGGRTYIGSYDNVLPFATAVILVNSDSNTQLTIYQSPDKSRTYTEIVNITGGTPFTKVFNITSPFLYTTLRNTTGTAQTYLNYEVLYREVAVPTPASVGSNVNIFDSSGNSIDSTSGALDVYLTNSLTVAGTVDIGNFPASQTVAGTVDVGNFPASQTVAGTVDVGNFPASQTVAGTVDIGNFPVTQDVNVLGNVYSGDNLQIELTNINTTYLSGDNLKVSIQEQFQPLETVNLSRASVQAYDGSVAAGDTSTALVVLNASTCVSVFGDVDGASTFSLQFSYDNANFYTTQYSITLTGAGNFGFTVPSASSFVRLKRTDAGAAVLAEVFMEAC